MNARWDSMTDEKLKEMYPKTFGRLFSYLENDPSGEFSSSELVIKLGFITREPVIRTILKNASWSEERQPGVFRFRPKTDQPPEREPEQLTIPFAADRKIDAEPPVKAAVTADSVQDPSAQKQKQQQLQQQQQKQKEEQMRIGFRGADEMRVGTVVKVKSGARNGSLTVDFGPTIGKHRVPAADMAGADLEGKQVVFRMGEKIEALRTEDGGTFVVTAAPVENGLRVK